MARFRLQVQPEVEAVQWDGTHKSYNDTVMPFCHKAVRNAVQDVMTINTPEGVCIVGKGDWIIKDRKGNISSCKSDIFDKTYEMI